MKYEGFICGHPVSYENPYPLHSGLYLPATYAGVVNVMGMLPETISGYDFLKGMMRLTRGTVKPTIILEVYDDFEEKVC